MSHMFNAEFNTRGDTVRTHRCPVGLVVDLFAIPPDHSPAGFFVRFPFYSTFHSFTASSFTLLLFFIVLPPDLPLR